MEQKSLEKLVHTMIQADLTCSRLVFGLINLNVDAGIYSLDLRQSVLSLMGFHQPVSEFAFEYYESLMSTSVEVEMHNLEDMKVRTAEVYELLKQLKVYQDQLLSLRMLQP